MRCGRLRSGRLRHVALASIFLGLSALARNDGLILFLVFVPIAVLLGAPLSRWWQSLAASVVPFVALVAGTTGWAIYRAAGWRAVAVAVLVGGVGIAALGLIPHGGADADAKYQRTLYPAATQQP